MDCCALCNEPINEIDFEVSSVEVINGEYWHCLLYTSDAADE